MCDCENRPRCEMKWCSSPARWSVNLQDRFLFVCDWHYREARKPIPGITRPDHADEDWRPSLMDMIRLADIAIKFEERSVRSKQIAAVSDQAIRSYWHDYEKRRGFTPAQVANFRSLQQMRRRMNHSPHVNHGTDK